MISRRRFVQFAAALVGGGVGVGYYTWRIEPHWVELVRRDLPVRNLPAALEGQTLVQLSDLHVGPRVDDDFLRGAFDLVHALEPAFVALTGDFMTCKRGEQVDHALKVMESLRPGRLGTFAVLGNHDYGWSWREVDVADRLARGLTDQGIEVLRNRQRTVAGLTFVGLDDYWSPYFSVSEALGGLAPDAAAVALCHNPDGADKPGWDGYRGWILAGHTHGGQCKPPFLPPPILPVRNPRYVAGEIDLGDGRTLYINRALGHLLQVRFNARPEITVFRLTRAAESTPGLS